MKGRIDTKNNEIRGKTEEIPMLCGLPVVIGGRRARLEMDERGWYAVDADGWRLYRLDGVTVETEYDW